MNFFLSEIPKQDLPLGVPPNVGGGGMLVLGTPGTGVSDLGIGVLLYPDGSGASVFDLGQGGPVATGASAG